MSGSKGVKTCIDILRLLGCTLEHLFNSVGCYGPDLPLRVASAPCVSDSGQGGAYVLLGGPYGTRTLQTFWTNLLFVKAEKKLENTYFYKIFQKFV